MATVGWGRDGWNTGAWGTSPDAVAVITGISSSTSVGNVFAAAPSLTTISGQVINSGVSNVTVGIAVKEGAAANTLPTDVDDDIPVMTATASGDVPHAPVFHPSLPQPTVAIRSFSLCYSD